MTFHKYCVGQSRLPHGLVTVARHNEHKVHQSVTVVFLNLGRQICQIQPIFTVKQKQ